MFSDIETCEYNIFWSENYRKENGTSQNPSKISKSTLNWEKIKKIFKKLEKKSKRGKKSKIENQTNFAILTSFFYFFISDWNSQYICWNSASTKVPKPKRNTKKTQSKTKIIKCGKISNRNSAYWMMKKKQKWNADRPNWMQKVVKNAQTMVLSS